MPPITVHIPGDAAEALRRAFGNNLDRAALEAMVLEAYRTRKFGISQVRRLLGLANRWEAEEWLGRHGATWNYSVQDLDDDLKTIDELFPKAA